MEGTITNFFERDLWIIGHILFAGLLDLYLLVFPLRPIELSLVTVIFRKHSTDYNSKTYDPIRIKLRRWTVLAD